MAWGQEQLSQYSLGLDFFHILPGKIQKKSISYYENKSNEPAEQIIYHKSNFSYKYA